MKKGVTFFWLILIAIIVAGIGLSFYSSSQPGPYDALAQCIEKNDVKFYGAFWCPHCEATKRLFGRSAKLLPYVECSTADGQGQTQICKDKDITSYPTWIRPDGARFNGEHTVEEWAAFSGCTVDGQRTDFAPVQAATGASSAAQ